MIAFALTIALALVSHSSSQAAQRAQSAAAFPSKGVVVPGVSFAGIKLGDTEQHVRVGLGKPFHDRAASVPTRPGSTPIAVASRSERECASARTVVVAVFSLGSPAGWKTDKGLNMGDPVSNVYNYYGNTGTTLCLGYDTLTVRVGNAVTAFYSAAGVVYGFALVARASPSVSSAGAGNRLSAWPRRAA